MIGRFDWSQVAHQESCGDGPDGSLPAPFSELGRRSGRSEAEGEADFWSPVSHRWPTEGDCACSGAASGHCGGRCGGAQRAAAGTALRDEGRRSTASPSPAAVRSARAPHRRRDWGPPDDLRLGETADQGLDLMGEADLEGHCRDRWGEYTDCCKPLCSSGPCGVGCGEEEESCELLAPRDGWESDPQQKCSADFVGSTVACEVCLREQDWNDMNTTALLHRDEANAAIRFKDVEADLQEIVLFSWALLIGNLDLVEWSLCMALGSDSQERYLHRLQRWLAGDRWFRVTIQGALSNEFNDSSSPAARLGRTIKLNTDGLFWPWLVEAWTTVIDSKDTNRLGCLLVGAAQILCHELLHLCRVPADPNHNSGGSDVCDAVYNATSALGFALVQRYSFSQGELCCAAGRMLANYEQTPASSCAGVYVG